MCYLGNVLHTASDNQDATPQETIHDNYILVHISYEMCVGERDVLHKHEETPKYSSQPIKHTHVQAHWSQHANSFIIWAS